MEIESMSSSYGVFTIFNEDQHFSHAPTLHQEEIIYQIQVSFLESFQASHLLLLTSKNIILKPWSRAVDKRSIYYVPISFQLKFQTLYEAENNPNSKKIGITLFKNSQQSNHFFSKNASALNQVRIHLNRCLNQRGFHAQFKPISRLGKGNFATVYEVLRIEDNAKFAVKAFSKANSFSTENGKQSLLNQLKILRVISNKSDNLLNLEAIYQSDNSIYVVMELLKGKTLYDLIKEKKGKFTQGEVKDIMKGILKGLKCLDENDIMHRDLKPENIMLRTSGYPSYQPVIVDFGLSVYKKDAPYLFYRCGTPGFVAPEIVRLTQNTEYDVVCDVFSLGCIFHLLMTNGAVFPGTKYQQVFSKNKNMETDIKEFSINQFHPFAFTLLKNMLTEKPELRIRASNALEHRFFKFGQSISEKLEDEQMTDCLAVYT